jgi:O-antigen/teichoic acid export membrane protein
LTRAAIAQFGWRVTAGLLAALTAILVAVALGLATLGLIATTTTVALGSSVLAGGGFSHAVAFIVARDRAASAAVVRRGLAATLAISLVGATILVIVGPRLLPALPVLWGHAAVALPFVQIGQLGLGLHQGLGSNRGYVATYLAQPLAGFCVAAVAAALAGAPDVGTWAGALVVAPFIVQAAAVVPAWLRLPRGEGAGSIRTLASYTARIYPSAVGHYLSYRLDLLLVGALLGATAAGIYSLALNGVDAVARIGQAAATVLFPRFAVMPDAHEAARLVRRAAAIGGGLSLASLAILAGVVLLASGFLSPDVRTIGVLLVILTVAGGSISAWGIIASYLAARDRLGATARVNLVLLVTSLLLYVTLIPTLGLQGAAAGTSAGLLLAALLGYHEVAEHAIRP